MKSIFERIDEVVKENGCVPAGYVLEEALKPGEIPCVHMGEQEGLLRHPGKPAGRDELKKAVGIIKESLKINARLAVHSFDDNDLGFRVADIRGQLLKNIVDNIKDYDPHKLSTLAYSLVIFGKKLETVKLGLLLLVLFNFADDEVVKKHLITLGLYEEFTSYVISNVSGWPEETRDHVYYVYAQKLNGWGKINAMDRIEPINDEVKEWILCNGCSNDINFGYLGRIAYDKSGVEERLIKGNLTSEEMQGARDIMRGLLIGGESGDLKGLDNPARFARAYLNEQVSHTVRLEDISNMYELRTFLRDWDKQGVNDDAEAALKLIERILSLSDAEEMIREGLLYDPDIAVCAARDGSIDISGELLKLMKGDIEKYCRYSPYFLADDRYVKEFLDICEHKLNGYDFDVVPTDQETADVKTWRLDKVLKYLGKYPGMGSKIVVAAMGSVIPNYRFGAAKVIREWEELQGKNIKKINLEVSHTIKKVRKKETDEALKKEWDALADYK
ncbi:MAG: hypothetical protein IKT17_01675 [Lachnospiraceae bacterium]|nr:hypothetical protein [Lachnospiraceae bacterium]